MNAFRLIAVGLGIWTISTAGCGIAMGFWSLILCRMLVGVGEASFVALASPFIGTFVAILIMAVLVQEFVSSKQHSFSRQSWC